MATLSAVRLVEDYEREVNLHAKNNSLKHVKCLGSIKEGLDMIDTNHDDIESNIDCIDLGTEDEYVSSVYTARSLSPTSRYINAHL